MKILSDLARKGYKNSIIVLWNILLKKNATKINAVNQKNSEKKFKGYNSVSLKITIDGNFDRYAILWVTSLNIMFPNTVLAVAKFEIAYANYSSTQLHKKFFEKVQSMLGEKKFQDTLK